MNVDANLCLRACSPLRPKASAKIFENVKRKIQFHLRVRAPFVKIQIFHPTPVSQHTAARVLSPLCARASTEAGSAAPRAPRFALSKSSRAPYLRTTVYLAKKILWTKSFSSNVLLNVGMLMSL